MSGRTIDAGLDLLDHQMVDKDGLMAGVVDDLEFEWVDGESVAYVVAILSGPEAWAGRLGGRMGRWIASVHHRLHDRSHPGPARVSLGIVKRISDHVELTVARSDLEISRSRDWVRDTIISKIPGAQRAPE
jgi:hypothetical protein